MRHFIRLGVVGLLCFSSLAFSMMREHEEEEYPPASLCEPMKRAFPTLKTQGDGTSLLQEMEKSFFLKLEVFKKAASGRTCFISHVYNPKDSLPGIYAQNPEAYNYYDGFYVFLKKCLQATGFVPLLDMEDIHAEASIEDFCDKAGTCDHVIAVMIPLYKKRFENPSSGVHREYKKITAKRLQAPERCHTILLAGDPYESIIPLADGHIPYYNDFRNPLKVYKNFFALTKCLLPHCADEINRMEGRFLESQETLRYPKATKLSDIPGIRRCLRRGFLEINEDSMEKMAGYFDQNLHLSQAYEKGVVITSGGEHVRTILMGFEKIKKLSIKLMKTQDRESILVALWDSFPLYYDLEEIVLQNLGMTYDDMEELLSSLGDWSSLKRLDLEENNLTIPQILSLKTKYERVPLDMDEAEAYYERAAERGTAEEKRELALMYEEGKNIRVNPEKAILWHEKAATLGDVLSTQKLQVHRRKLEEKEAERLWELARSCERTKNFKTAILHYQALADMRDIRAVFHLASIFEVQGALGKPEPFYKQILEFVFQNEGGDFRAQGLSRGNVAFALGQFIEERPSKLVNMNAKDALEYYMIAAKEGHIEGAFRAGYLFSYDEKHKRKQYLKQAADKGHIEATFQLAHDCYGGEEEGEKYEYYRKAADRGHVEAMYKLSDQRFSSRFRCGSRDYDEDMKRKEEEKGFWLEKAAEAGHAQAASNLAYRYDRDYKTASQTIDQKERELRSCKQDTSEYYSLNREICRLGGIVREHPAIIVKFYTIAMKNGKEKDLTEGAACALFSFQKAQLEKTLSKVLLPFYDEKNRVERSYERLEYSQRRDEAQKRNIGSIEVRENAAKEEWRKPHVKEMVALCNVLAPYCKALSFVPELYTFRKDELIDSYLKAWKKTKDDDDRIFLEACYREGKKELYASYAELRNKMDHTAAQRKLKIH